MSDRISARLASLPHEALVALAATMYGDAANTHSIRDTEACLASHIPTPQWALDTILLSDDILPHIFAHIELKDGAAAAVCTAFRSAWVATDEQRRGLRLTPISCELERHRRFVTLPGDRLAHFTPTGARIFDRNLATIDVPMAYPDHIAVTAHEDAAYFSLDEEPALCRYELTNDEHILGARTKYYEDDRGEGVAYDGFSEMCVSPNGTLFAVGFKDGENDEIVAFDATTLSVRFRFGRGRINLAASIAASGQELFVCSKYDEMVCVFSLSGEHLRDIKIDCESEYIYQPEYIRLHGDRLYVADCNNLIYVLSLDGQLLQKYKMRDEDGLEVSYIVGMFVLDKKLIVQCNKCDITRVNGVGTRDKFFALKGL